jgi:signal transduction histidine kinase
MWNKNIRTAIQERFGFKVFTVVIFVIIFVLTVYTVIGAVHESNKAKEKLKEQGEMLVALLSHSSLVGIVAEDAEMLDNATTGILGLRDVKTVLVYNANAKLLYNSESRTSPEKISTGISGDTLGDLKDASRLTVVETADSFHFTKPVTVMSRSEVDESMYFAPTGPADTERVIGYVRIELGKESYRKDIVSLVKRNAVMMLVFIAVSGIIIFFAVKKVTRPIKKLTDKVRSLELGLPVEPASVETRDEIGKLESAFDAMVEVRGMAEKMLRESEERERHLLATYLHDFVGQNLVASQYKLGALKKRLSTDDSRKDIDEVRELIAETIQYTRSLTVELSSPVLEEIGLQAAIESLAESYESTYEVLVKVEDDGLPKEISDETGYLLFRSVREILMNIVKHAKATETRIVMAVDGDNIRITVRDNGIGFIAAAAPKPGHSFGLFTIRERLRGLGGRCDIESAPGAGTTVVLTAPLVKSKDQEKGTT